MITWTKIAKTVASWTKVSKPEVENLFELQDGSLFALQDGSNLNFPSLFQNSWNKIAKP